MNEQLPPIDSGLREQLARRSAGRLPDGLVVDVFAALDSRPPRRTIWRIPRLAVAGLSLAIVAVLAVTIAFSGTHTAPAATTPSLNGYPAERALTTAELASLMAGPALPLNTALVASVTIDVRNDVCPMDRYQTQGVVEGMASQVCVMTAGAAVQPMTLTGTFAFRYLGPGYLGLVGKIAPASLSTLAFKVADSWPDTGTTFLVDGWLGADELMSHCAAAPSAGDILAPDGGDCPFDNWLGDGPTAPGIQADHEYAGTSTPTYDPLSLRGNARHVLAGGMRLIDLIDHAAPMKGVYVVTAATEGCPGDAITSSRGCSTWRVLARVADISMPVPNPSSPAATPSRTSTLAPPATPIVQPSVPPSLAPVGLLGSGNRPLTANELTNLIAADPAGMVGRTAIVKGPVPLGQCQKFESSIMCSDMLSPSTGEGSFAVRVGTSGQLSLVGGGPIEVGPHGLVWTLPQVTTSKPSGLVVVDAWLDYANDCDTPNSQPPCVFSVLTATEISWMHMRSLFPLDQPNYWVQPNDASLAFGPQDHFVKAIHGLYLVDGGSSTILARLETAGLP